MGTPVPSPITDFMLAMICRAQLHAEFAEDRAAAARSHAEEFGLSDEDIIFLAEATATEIVGKMVDDAGETECATYRVTCDDKHWLIVTLCKPGASTTGGGDPATT